MLNIEIGQNDNTCGVHEKNELYRKSSRCLGSRNPRRVGQCS